jgi:hypothetical protein
MNPLNARPDQSVNWKALVLILVLAVVARGLMLINDGIY